MKLRRSYSNVVAVALAAAVGGIAFAGHDGSGVKCDGFAFDVATWRSSTTIRGDTPTPRQRLADGLVACQTLEGRSTTEVQSLLGRPDERDSEGLSYQLGPERGPLKIDSEYLDVVIRNDKVVETSLYVG